MLVLRVFGIDRQANFTFDGLLTYWRHFGSHYIVVDHTLIKHQQTYERWYVPGIFGLTLLFIGSLQIDGLYETGSVLFTGRWWVPGGVIVLGVLYAYLSVRLVGRRFMKSRVEVDRRIADINANPGNLNLTFRNLSMLCHANVWKHAVAACSEACQVVMMDLRGFIPEKKGCAYEVDFLFDTVPLQRLLFLVDEQAAPAVETLLAERWSRLHPDSPNLGLAEPGVRLYVASREDGKDVQGILDTLLDTATGEQADADR